ncbi:hypothetical protein SAMN07250955_102325 [Arboricoccus pini]|uniref:Uncharacterized protein n=1 Tax=Arboricoccus pini TaxID=1963835 RepID=A0A212QQB0_9PROT|nr:hypothetical protein SAMN07250955_102325 [Arboricoccus pini]
MVAFMRPDFLGTLPIAGVPSIKVPGGARIRRRMPATGSKA